MLKRLFIAALLLICGNGAGATILVTWDEAASTGTDWVYNVTMQPSTYMSASQGDYFVVYDFLGLQDADFIKDPGVADRTFSIDRSNTGVSPPPFTVAPVDNPAIENVTVTLVGGPDIVPPLTGAPVQLGQLILTGLSDIPGPEVNFVGKSIKLADNTRAMNIGSVQTPVIPEASTIGFMGAGLLAMVGLAIHRRRRLI